MKSLEEQPSQPKPAVVISVNTFTAAKTVALTKSGSRPSS